MAKEGPDPVDFGVLVRTLSLDQKTALTGGASYWWTHGVPEIGLAPLHLSDGPSGVRGETLDERQPSVCVPCGTALAASWDPGLIRRVGQLLGDEARRLNVHVLLGPTMNVHRSPLGGRGFECLSEDPTLSGVIAAGYVEGLQSRGVAATPKHFVCNDAETARTRVDNVVGQRALREIYLVPFEHAVRAGAWALMAGYNRVNGQYCSAHDALLSGVLKGEWGWDGLVMTDWYAKGDTVGSARAGLDLEMPGPPRFFGPGLAEAVRAGQLDEAVLDDKAERLLRLAHRVGRLAAPEPAAPQPDAALPPAMPREQVDELLLEAAASSFVLLKNDRGLLPLDLPVLRRVAVIGPNAARPCYQGGGSAEVELEPVPSILDAIRDRLDGIATVVHEPGGGRVADEIPGLHLLDVRPPGRPGAHGVMVEYYPADVSAESEPTAREVRNSSRLIWLDGPPDGDLSSGATVRVSAVLTPTDDGVHTFALRGTGDCVLYVDGGKVTTFTPTDHSPLGVAFNDEGLEAEVTLSADRSALVEIEMAMTPGKPNLLGFGCLPPQAPDEDLVERATAAAADADVVVLVLGTTSEVEAEGNDRTTTQLPGLQDTLAQKVLAANADTVVVMNAGSGVDLPWADAADTILYTWFPGQAYGPALADVLAGVREPSGRMPITIARRHEDYPVWSTRPDADDRLAYDESVFVGYRHFDQAGIEPQFCFGHGLGYGEVGYEGLALSAQELHAGEPLRLTVTVRNISPRPTKEIVQVYVHDEQAALPRPPRELKAFVPVELAAGQTETVTVALDARAFAYWDDAAAAWIVEPGRFEIQVGRSSRDIRLTEQVTMLRGELR